LATFWAIVSQTHLVTLLATAEGNFKTALKRTLEQQQQESKISRRFFFPVQLIFLSLSSQSFITILSEESRWVTMELNVWAKAAKEPFPQSLLHWPTFH
jgi:hypothetical protein